MQNIKLTLGVIAVSLGILAIAGQANAGERTAPPSGTCYACDAYVPHSGGSKAPASGFNALEAQSFLNDLLAQAQANIQARQDRLDALNAASQRFLSSQSSGDAGSAFNSALFR